MVFYSLRRVVIGTFLTREAGEGTARKRGGGGARQDHFGRQARDRVGDLIWVAHDLARRNAHYSKPSRLKPRVTA